MDKMPKELTQNLFHMIDDQWMLVTAKKPDGSYNMLTASWGATGILWNKPVSILFIRESRYTREFLDAADSYTLTFFPESKRPILTELGVKSGRDIDKMALDGLTPVDCEGSVGFEEATLTMVCRKLFCSQMDDKSILVPEIIKEQYAADDYHYIYIGEIVKCIEK